MCLKNIEFLFKFLINTSLFFLCVCVLGAGLRGNHAEMVLWGGGRAWLGGKS